MIQTTTQKREDRVKFKRTSNGEYTNQNFTLRKVTDTPRSNGMWDIFVSGEWSRRFFTKKECVEFLTNNKEV